ncbi:MAG: Na/Pi cotransporter family protein, partial [Lachnospiraceae bacterium]|nr:Na/Pi cotransporter family protein [Lachnospiraceae bacterium]
KDAKRAALIHFWFNVIGTVLIYIILAFAMEPVIAMIQSISKDNGRFVANAHTIIKIFQVIVLFPFANWIVKLATICVPGEDRKINYRESYQLKYIGEKVVFNPATAVVEVIKELERMADLANENLNRAMNALITLDEEDIEEVYEVEKNIDFLNSAITDYLVKINQSTLPIEDLKSLGALFHVANDIERIGDHAENVADAARERKESGVTISKVAQRELGEMLDMVNKIIQDAINMFAHSDESKMQEVIELEKKVDEKERELQKMHVDRLSRGECTPEAGMIFSDIVSGLERVADHATNIAFAIVTAEKDEEATEA